MQFNPKIGFVLGILVTIETAISGGLLNLTNAVPAGWLPTVIAWSGILAFGGSTILTFLHGYSSGQAGPLVSTPLDMNALQKQASQGVLAQPPKAIILILLVAAALLLPGAAFAQAPRPFVPTGNLPKDIAATRPAPAVAPSGKVDYDSLGGQFQAVVKDVIDRAILDLTAASKDAAGQNPPDLISQPCWDAQIAFLKLLPAEWPEPPTNVGPALAIQIGRDLRRALTGDQRGTIKVDCAALFGDELAQLGKLGGLVGLKIATGGL